MRPVMTVTDKSPAASAKLLDDKASLYFESKSTYSAERRVLYAFWDLIQYDIIVQKLSKITDINSALSTQARARTEDKLAIIY